MENWPELLFWYFVFSSVITPGIVYTTYTYEPSDPLGWISKAVFALISFCCVLVFIPSVIFIYFYHWLYRKRSDRKAAHGGSRKTSILYAIVISILSTVIYYASILVVSMILAVIFTLFEYIPLVGTLFSLLSSSLSRTVGVDPNEVFIFFGMLSGVQAVCWIADKTNRHLPTCRLSLVITSSILFVSHTVSLISNIVHGQTVLYTLIGFAFVYDIFNHRKFYPSVDSNPIPVSVSALDTSAPESKYLMESKNGTLVWVPVSKLEQWQYYQEHPEENPLLQQNEDSIDELLDSLYDSPDVPVQ